MNDKSKPLAGKRVVVTRSPDQAGELTRRLEALGAEVLLLPAMGFSEPEDYAPLDQALGALPSFDWVLFTSRNAVQYFAGRARALGFDCSALQTPRPLVAAVGPATAQAAEAVGFRVDHLAAVHSAQALSKELWSVVAARRVLLPRSDRARPELSEALRKAGAEVVEVVAYRTNAGPLDQNGALELVRRGEVDVLSFASPSAFHHLADELGPETLVRLAERVRLAAIGPTTAAAVRAAGLPVAIVAAEATAAGLAEAIANHFARQLPSGVKSR